MVVIVTAKTVIDIIAFLFSVIYVLILFIFVALLVSVIFTIVVGILLQIKEIFSDLNLNRRK